MPLYNPPSASGNNNVSVNGEGYVVVENGPPPFKVISTDLGGGVHRYELIVKDGAENVTVTTSEKTGF
jgi:hypothetical protein